MYNLNRKSTIKWKHRGMPVAMLDGWDTSLQCIDLIMYCGHQWKFQCNGYKMFSLYKAYLNNLIPVNSCLLECDVISMDERFVMYCAVTVPSSSRVTLSKCRSQAASSLTMKTPWSFKMSRTSSLMTQYHIPEALNPQQHQRENLQLQNQIP